MGEGKISVVLSVELMRATREGYDFGRGDRGAELHRSSRLPLAPAGSGAELADDPVAPRELCRNDARAGPALAARASQQHSYIALNFLEAGQACGISPNHQYSTRRSLLVGRASELRAPPGMIAGREMRLRSAGGYTRAVYAEAAARSHPSRQGN